MNKRYQITKRLIDMCSSLIGLVLLSPVFLLIALWIKLDSVGPVFFKQVRIGKEGKSFHIYKFRTMISDAENVGKQLTTANDKRITRCGAILRKFKLDELPQLINVVKGEMSLVGPRPEVPTYVRLYNDQQRKVLTVAPGLTDEASIKYRNESELLYHAADAEQMYIEQIMPDKLSMNIQYIEKPSLLADFQIICKTIWVVIKK
ncbi:sugar transferase [Brevibacillus daliensis]|uniref:sugar transferase n=1 Tax=Brevibacillus daliensis TaxID=2892995 RepID=UPI001E631475|nr:sugar transferase [Brevibacillus daliensis]